MAIIHGTPGAQDKLFGEIEREHQVPAHKIKIKYKQIREKNEKNWLQFMENVPKEIDSNERTVHELKEEIKLIDKLYSKKVREIETTRSKIKKDINSFFKYILYFVIFIGWIEKNRAISKKEKEIEEKDKEIKEHEAHINLLKYEPYELFKEENKELLDLEENYDYLRINDDNSDYIGAVGESQVLEELQKLSNNHHVICNAHLELNRYVRYRHEGYVKSAQVDFIVVGPEGIYLLEVKNWRSDHTGMFTHFSPFEQIDRAYLIMKQYLLYHDLYKYRRYLHKVVVDVQGAINYHNKKNVYVSEIYNLIRHIVKHRDVMNIEEIKNIVNIIK